MYKKKKNGLNVQEKKSVQWMKLHLNAFKNWAHFFSYLQDCHLLFLSLFFLCKLDQIPGSKKNKVWFGVWLLKIDFK